MKRLFIITALVLMCIFSTAQDWAPLGTKWWYNVWPFDLFDPVNYTAIESIGDTSINGKNCRILIRTWGCSDGIGEKEYLYRDSNILYRYHPVLDSFTILYNFGASQGETWPVYPIWPFVIDSFTVMVDSTDSMIIGSQKLKVQFISNTPAQWKFSGMVVENIGLMGYEDNDRTYFFPQYGGCDPHAGPLRCYEDALMGTYEKWDSIACDSVYYISGLKEVGRRKVKMVANITVSDGRLSVNINCSTTENSSFFVLEIYSLSGKKLWNEQISCGYNQLNVSNVGKGVFLIKISSDANTYTSKILIK